MANKYETKLWGGRFREGEDNLMERFQNGFQKTLWLLEPDIRGSLAHVAMQVKVGLLTPEEGKALTDGLESIRKDLEEGKLDLSGDYEDVHTFVELELVSRVGAVGKKLHAARSRNDQCNTDMKLYVRDETRKMVELLKSYAATLYRVAEENPCIMPGYTHLQRAQVVTMKYYLKAYASMAERDIKRLNNALAVMDESPLGCGALAGTTHSIDRDFSAEQLGFSAPYANFMDGVSDRDYILEVMGDLSIMMMHLSRLAEELVLWSSAEFGFITLDDKYTTGSSIMPQKKNPDGAELVRGHTGRVYGDQIILLTVMKGLPLAYNKDMFEDKPTFYDSMQTSMICVQMMERMIATMKVHPEVLKKAVKKGFLNATEVADYLVRHGVAFRDAHAIVGNIVIACEDRGKTIEEMSLEELQEFSPVIQQDIFESIDYVNILHQGIKKEML